MRAFAVMVAVVAVATAACGSKKSDKDKPKPTAGTAGSGSAGRATGGSDEEATAVEPDTGSGTGKPGGPLRPTADLTLTGAVTAKLVGTAGTCTCRGDTANITMRSDDLKVAPSFELNILVTEPAEWTDPAMVINVKEPQRGSFGRNRVRHGPDDKASVA